MSSDAPTSRQRETLGGEEEVSTELKLGEFTGVQSLTLSEAKVVIDAVLKNRKMAGRRYNETETLLKMQDYLDMFARFKTEANTTAVAVLLETHPELEKFERSQLGTLCCETADEAKTLIPSLTNKISDADLQELLDEISKNRQFAE